MPLPRIRAIRPGLEGIITPAPPITAKRAGPGPRPQAS